MPALHEIQAAFLHDIYTGERTSAMFLARNAYGSPERLDLYFNNTLFGLTDLLAAAYPVLQRVVGEDFFKTLARFYMRAYPQPDGNRHNFGAELEQFLTTFKPAEALLYLPDLAKLEWAMHAAYFAEDAGVLVFDTLAARLEDAGDISLALHPSASVISVAYNVLEIWEAHQKADVGELILLEESKNLLVWRDFKNTVLVRVLSPALARLCSVCQAGGDFLESMAQATEGLADLEPLQQEFGQVMSFGAFIEVS